MSKYKVKESNDLDVIEFKVVKTQTRIAYGVLIFCALFIVSTALYGVWKDDFSGLKEVLVYVQMPVAFILGYYFRGQNGEDKLNNESPDGTS